MSWDTSSWDSFFVIGASLDILNTSWDKVTKKSYNKDSAHEGNFASSWDNRSSWDRSVEFK